MGTNFYWKHKLETADSDEADMNPSIHIGKRSAAGLYCWDCMTTLCRGGEKEVHTSRYYYPERQWHPECPKCGKTKEESTEEHSAGMVELGFQKPITKRLKGISSCSSFTFAQTPANVKQACLDHHNDVIIINEYKQEYTGKQFLDMLRFNCPIEFLAIEEWFC